MAAKQNLDSIIEGLDATDTIEGLQELTLSLRRSFQIDHVVYHWVDSEGDHFGCGTYSIEWTQRYTERSYVRIDPVIVGCFQRFHPVDWGTLDWSSKAAREFRKDAIAHGVGSQGISIPIRGPNGQFALFTASHTCCDSEWAEFTKHYGRDLILIAHFFNRKALEIAPNRAPEQTSTLSPREIDAMTLLAMGYSRSQVASALSISEHTLRVYIESARFKLGALNTTHAVARAIGRGLIVV